MKKKQLILSLVLLICAVAALIVCLNQVNNDGSNQTTTAPSVVTPDGKELNQYKTYAWSYFDTVTTIVGYAETGEEFEAIAQQIFVALEEYHKLYDIYNSYSGINNIRTINKLYDGEHKVVTVDRKIIDMLLYAKELYAKTNGKMNVAMGSVLSIWHDYRSDAIDNHYGVGELPPMEMLQEAAQHTDINNLIIDEENSTVYLADPKMTLDVGAIAKGYAVEMVARMLEEQGITAFVINVGGNIRTIGSRADGKTWATGVENPIGDDPAYIAYLGLSGQAIVTSGSYQRYYIVDGKEYHHIIDGETLMPATYFVGVSVICKSSADGDGLSTALFCMSLEEGQALVEFLEGVEVMWTLPDGTQIRSSGFSHYEDQYKK